MASASGEGGLGPTEPQGPRDAARTKSAPGQGNVWIGTSGWVYPHWKGRFYPAKLPASRWLAHYASIFDTVELNNPFYRQPSRQTFERWRDAVPDSFVYSVKLNRFLTHIKRLNIEAESVERSYGTMAGLGRKLGVVLAQLPPKMKFEAERVDRYFRMVSRRRRRHALEPRDDSWFSAESQALLRRRKVALCIQDSAKWTTRPDLVTADFVYLRFHGPEALYGSGYSDAQLREWAKRICDWLAGGLEVYAYFNNDVPDHAPRDAQRLRELIGGPARDRCPAFRAGNSSRARGCARAEGLASAPAQDEVLRRGRVALARQDLELDRLVAVGLYLHVDVRRGAAVDARERALEGVPALRVGAHAALVRGVVTVGRAWTFLAVNA